MNNFDRRQLRYFVAVAEELHFGNAAKRLHMSQPPLSQQIAALEYDLGVKLFVRTKRKVEITPAGEQFLKDARLILADMTKAGMRARRAAEGQTGTLRIGLNYSAPISSLPSNIFRNFTRLYPNIGLELHENIGEKQLDGLLHRKLDFCFIWATHDDASSDITVLPLSNDELKLIMSREHRLAHRRMINARDLKNETIYLTLRQTRTPFYDALITACRKEDFEPDIRTDVIQIAFNMNIAAATQGISFIPEFYNRIRPSGTVLHSCNFIPRAHRIMPLSLTYRSNDTSPLVQNFIKTAKSAV